MISLVRTAVAWVSLAQVAVAFAQGVHDGGPPPAPPAEFADGDDLLENWLDRHKLNELLVVLRERELAGETSQDRRTRLAELLARDYAAQLGTARNVDRTLAAWDELIREFPQAADIPAQVAVEFGRYRQTRRLLDDWMWSSRAVVEREQIHQRFGELVARAELLANKASQTVSAAGQPPAETGLFLGENEQPDAPANEESPHDRPVTRAQAEYLLAWSLCFQVATGDTNAPDRLERLHRANKLFRQLMLVPDESTLAELRPEWYSLESRWFCQLIAGAGMVSLALGNDRDAEYCFRLLDDPRVSPEIRRLHRVWTFQSLLWFASMERAATWAATLIDNDPGSRADNELWRMVALTGLGPRRATVTDEMAWDELAVTGLSQLASGENWLQVDELLDDTTRPLRGGGFFANWLEGYRLLRLMRQPGRAETASLKTARLALEEALKRSETAVPGVTSDIQFRVRARCRLDYGAVLLLEGQYEEAVDQFRLAEAALRRFDNEATEQAVWNTCLALERLCERDLIWAAALSRELRRFEQQFPDAARRHDVAFLRMVADANGNRADEARRELLNVPPGDRNHTRAMLEAGRLAHLKWTTSDDDTRRDQLVAEVVEAATRLGAAVSERPDAVDNHRFQQICLYAADVMLHGRAADLKEAESWLARFHEVGTGGGGFGPLESEWRLLDLQIARARGDDARVAANALWLSESGERAEHRSAGWLARAELVERQLPPEVDPDSGDTRAGGDRQLLEEASGYLFKALQAAREVNGTRPNEIIARLARLQWRLGQVEEAWTLYSEVLQAAPDRIEWQRGAALAAMELGQFTDAAGYWRSIAAARSAGDNEWMEAKYRLALCLAPDDPEAAAAVLDQTRLLVPEGSMSAGWASRFDELAARVKQQGPR